MLRAQCVHAPRSADLADELLQLRRPHAGLDELARGTPGQKPIHPQYLARLLSEQAAEHAVFTADVGTPTIWPAGVDASAFYSHIHGMNKLLSAALTTTATAYGGSPAGCAR